MKNLLQPHQAAQALGVTPERVRQLADAGRLPVVRIGRLRFFSPEDVERLKRERELRRRKKER